MAMKHEDLVMRITQEPSIRFRIALMACLIVLGLSHAAGNATGQSESDTISDIGEVRSYSVAATRTGEKSLQADIYKPRGQPRGAVILAHGGAFVTGSRRIGENKTYATALTDRGYLVLAISYRLLGDEPVVDGWARRYADDIRRSDDPLIRWGIDQYGADWPVAAAAAAQDLNGAVSWLRDQAAGYGVDPDNIALFGASAGAIAAMAVGFQHDDYTGRAADVAAVIDLRGMLMPVGRDSLDPADLPLLIFHGESDDRLEPRYAQKVFNLADRAGLPVAFYTAPGFGHELGGEALLDLQTPSGLSVLDLIDQFLRAAFNESRQLPFSERGRLHP